MIRHILPSEVLDVDIDAPDASSAFPNQAVTPASPAGDEKGREKTNYTRTAGKWRHLVNLGRGIRDWADRADAIQRNGGDADLGPLRYHSAQNRRFARNFRVFIGRAASGAQLNPLLRRGDLEGIRRLAREAQMLDMATIFLAPTRAECGARRERLN